MEKRYTGTLTVPLEGWEADLNFTVKDNYFSDVDSVRDMAVSDGLEWRLRDIATYPPYGWKGQRTKTFKNIGNKELLKIEKDIFNYMWEERNLKAWRYPTWDVGCQRKVKEIYHIKKQNLEDNPVVDPMISTYFHRTPADYVNYFWDYHADKYHKDYIPCGGVIYLNPNPPPLSGTSILDGKNSKLINLENVYNRLVAYDGYNHHAPTGCFGDSLETDRLTIVFFIHEKIFKENYDP